MQSLGGARFLEHDQRQAFRRAIGQQPVGGPIYLRAFGESPW